MTRFTIDKTSQRYNVSTGMIEVSILCNLTKNAWLLVKLRETKNVINFTLKLPLGYWQYKYGRKYQFHLTKYLTREKYFNRIAHG